MAENHLNWLGFVNRKFVTLEKKTEKGKDQIHVTPTKHTGYEKRDDSKANSPQERQVGNLG